MTVTFEYFIICDIICFIMYISDQKPNKYMTDIWLHFLTHFWQKVRKCSWINFSIFMSMSTLMHKKKNHYCFSKIIHAGMMWFGPAWCQDWFIFVYWSAWHLLDGTWAKTFLSMKSNYNMFHSYFMHRNFSPSSCWRKKLLLP